MNQSSLPADTVDSSTDSTTVLDFVITYATDGTTSWNCNGQTSGMCHASDNAKINFTFMCIDPIATKLVTAVLLVGPTRPESSGSPFGKDSPITLAPGVPLHIRPKAKGTWGFAIAFMTSDGDGNSQFYSLPDPELAVGSHGAGD